jgi:hypothetical protein
VVSGAYEKASAGAHLSALAQDAFDRDKDCSAIFLWIGHVNAVRLPPPLPKRPLATGLNARWRASRSLLTLTERFKEVCFRSVRSPSRCR